MGFRAQLVGVGILIVIILLNICRLKLWPCQFSVDARQQKAKHRSESFRAYSLLELSCSICQDEDLELGSFEMKKYFEMEK